MSDKDDFKAKLEESERIHRDIERDLVSQLSAARIRINGLEAELAGHRDPWEKRDDGVSVRKDRWQNAVRNIASIVGLGTVSWETSEVVDVVRQLAEKVKR